MQSDGHFPKPFLSKWNSKHVSNSSPLLLCDVQLPQCRPPTFSTLLSSGDTGPMRWSAFIIWLCSCVLILPYSRVVNSTDCGRTDNLQNVKGCQPPGTACLSLIAHHLTGSHTLISSRFLSITAESPDITAMKGTVSTAGASADGGGGGEGHHGKTRKKSRARGESSQENASDRKKT